MKRKLCYVFIALILVSSLTLTTFAGTYREDFDNIHPSTSVTYTNLEVGPYKPEYVDLHFAQMKDTRGTGEVIYRLVGASEVTASIYMSTSTVASQDKNGNHTLVTSANYADLLPTNQEVKYSPTTKQVYIFPSGASKYLTYDNTAGYIFSPQPNVPVDLINYGINFYASSDGVSYQRLRSIRNYSLNMPQGGLIMEEWNAKIPANVTYLKVQLNDISVINSYTTGEAHMKTNAQMTMLAQLEIKGDGLIIGVPEPIISEPNLTIKPEFNSSSSKTESSKKTSSTASKAKSEGSKAESSKAVNSKTGESSKIESITKFEGIVPDAPVSKKSSSSKPVANNKTTEKFAGSIASSQQITQATKDATALESGKAEDSHDTKEAVYFIEPSKVETTGGSSPYVIIYIFAVGLVVLLLLRKNIPKE